MTGKATDAMGSANERDAPVERTLGLRTATLLVVASMVGTGVFTTTGLLVADIGSVPAVLLCWVLGGVIALCGALAYGELVAALPTNGGEYALLGRIYHPSVGFVAGFVSFFVGFAAPTAASAIAFGLYLRGVLPGGPSWWPSAAGVALIVLVSILHVATVRRGSGFQDAMTALKIALIVVFLLGAAGHVEIRRLADGAPWLQASLSGPFAVGLILVSFAYTGWNAAAYTAGETIDPSRNLPLALTLGTGVVIALYLGLNVVFLAAVPMDALAGRVDVGYVAAEALFGPAASRLLSALIALGLVSTVGALVMTGPRVAEAMGHAHPRLRLLAWRRAGGGPVVATALHAAVATVMALTATFDALLVYVGVSLSLFAALTAAGVFVLRWREPELRRPYRTWGHPFTTLAFLALSAWMIAHTVLERPVVAGFAGGTLALGWVAWLAAGCRPRPP